MTLTSEPDRLPGHRRRLRPQGRVGRLRAALTRLGHDLRFWAVVLLLDVSVLVLDQAGVTLDDRVTAGAAVVATTALTVWLSVRAGGSAVQAAVLAGALSAAAVVTRSEVLLVGVAVGSAAVGTVLALLVTAPRARFLTSAVELLVAVLVAAVGAVTAAAYDAPVDPQRARDIVLVLGLLGTLGLVYRVTEGLHGLGRRGLVTLLVGTIVVFVVVAYTRALAEWGSADLRAAVADGEQRVRDVLGAVPRPGQLLLGFPALVWGVWQRARRPQGWWVCAFGAVGLAGVSAALLDGAVPVQEQALALGYSVLGGLVLGYAAIRLDVRLTGARGSRARRAEEAVAHRPEPGRFRPLI